MVRQMGPVLLVLLVLAVLLGPQGSAQEATAVSHGIPVFCDDPSVLKAAVSAMNTFNQRLSAGPQLALFQVLSACKDGSVYTLEFSSRRSECPVGGSRDWTECDFLSTGRKEPLLCNSTVSVTDTETETRQVACQLDDPIISERAPCLGCPEEISETSEDLKASLSLSIVKFNSESPFNHLFSLHRVGLATRQVIAGFRVMVMFDMRRTTCLKSDHKELSELCLHDDVKDLVYCNSTVDLAQWRHEPPQVQINCEPGALPQASRSKRRPPGWTPLRSAGLASTLSPPTSAPANQESSEEDSTGTRAPHLQPATAEVDLHHCPSSPWKPQPPARPVEGGPTSTLPGPTAPSADGTFSDSDLLG